MKYYIVVEEWKYPHDIGWEYMGEFSDSEEALNCCKGLAENEMNDFFDYCKTNPLNPTIYHNKDSQKEEGYIVTSEGGLDEFYYAARVIEVKSLA